MLAVDWGTVLQVVIGGVLIGLVAKLLGLISSGTKKGFKNEIKEEVHLALQEREAPVVKLAEELRLSQRRELDRIWSAIDDLRRRAGQ